MRQRGVRGGGEKKNGERMKENTYRKRENEVPQGANRSGFRIELGEVRDGAQEQTVVQLMMISLFDVHVISLFFFSPSPKVKCKEEKKKEGSASVSSPQDRDSPRLPLPRLLCPLSLSTPKHPGYLVPTVSDCQTSPLPLRGWPPCPPPPFHPPVQVSSLLSRSGF